MTANVTKIHIAQDTEEILSAQAFRSELDIIREEREKEAEHARLEAEALKLRQEKRLLLSKTAANDWERLILQMARTAISKALKRPPIRTYSFEISPYGLLLNGDSSLLGKSLKALGLEKKWSSRPSGYVDGTATLRDYAQAVHSLDSDVNSMRLEDRGRYYASGNQRYYDCCDATMEATEANQDTFMHLFSKLLMEVLERSGYQVENSIRLEKVKGSKATYEWVGKLKVRAE